MYKIVAYVEKRIQTYTETILHASKNIQVHVIRGAIQSHP